MSCGSTLCPSRRLIEAHAADVELSMEWLGAEARARETRTFAAIPGAHLSVLNSLKLSADMGFDPLGLAASQVRRVIWHV